MNLKEAFTTPFSQDNWFLKIFTGSLFYYSSYASYSILANNGFPLLGLIFAICLASVTNGYMLSIIHNRSQSDETYYPEWTSNIRTYMNRGLAAIIPVITYLFLLGVIIIVGGIIAALLFKEPPLTVSFFICLLLALSPVFLFYPQVLYAKNLKIGDCFNFSEIFGNIAKSFKNHLFRFVVIIALFFVYLAVSLLILFLFTPLYTLAVSLLYIIFSLICLNLLLPCASP